MSERMKRLVVSLPSNLRAAFLNAVNLDGRKPPEIVRALIEEWIRERSVMNFRTATCAEPGLRTKFK